MSDIVREAARRIDEAEASGLVDEEDIDWDNIGVEWKFSKKERSRMQKSPE